LIVDDEDEDEDDEDDDGDDDDDYDDDFLTNYQITMTKKKICLMAFQ